MYYFLGIFLDALNDIKEHSAVCSVNAEVLEEEEKEKEEKLEKYADAMKQEKKKDRKEKKEKKKEEKEKEVEEEEEDKEEANKDKTAKGEEENTTKNSTIQRKLDEVDFSHKHNVGRSASRAHQRRQSARRGRKLFDRSAMSSVG